MAFHTRSNSFPSTFDSLTQNVEDQLRRLRSSETTTSSSSSSHLVCQNLDGLKNRYECVDNWLQLPHMQKAFSQKQDDKCVQIFMDGSLSLLDLCSNMRDVFSHLKGSVQDLESSLRRKNGHDLNLSNEIENYFRTKKMANKMIQKCMAELKRVQKCNMTCNSELGLLRQVEEVSFIVFESLLSFVCPTKSESKSLLSKLIQGKRVSCELSDQEDIYGIEKIDVTLNSIKRNKCNTSIYAVQNGLKGLESNMKELEEGLECVFRFLIKTRVSLLNILSH